MNKRYSRALAAAAALVAGGLAAFALRPSQATSTQALAARNPAVEVRTEVIRRTIHITRHQGAAGIGSRGGSVLIARARAVKSGTSGSHHSAVAGAVATRTSGARPVGATGPVSTHTSGSHGSAGSTAVSTRTSGSSGSAGKPTTRSSGSHGGDGGDGGGDN
jgi:hypothetical protein